ncbi:MAG: methyl-accepting chemotaxis protein [Candidatus Ozemobacter sibiricus]|jgi:methyl-accepting chemotaxis protein|uniref:Methyl-accepting chemotaxis protein n=1 Tax=Candidatus Ozemobacter sibiricus TaxID=2268124 RepID=A0A367ZRA8_9BACT|nr:MAG: methyl-accepting chemotaxis protein [Candidatus Ozemobacter sibiricus]
MPKHLTTQAKLIGFLIVALLIPVGAANYILYRAKGATAQVPVVLGVRALPTQAETNLDFVEYVNSMGDRLDKLANTLRDLEAYARFFLVGSLLFIPLATVGFWALLEALNAPMREALKKLAYFLNEERGDEDGDVQTAAAEFEKFLMTARNILSETRSISQELVKKIEPLTTTSVFSDENVGQFFTDVQEISRSSNYIANTVEMTTASIQEVSTSAQTIAERSQAAASDSAGAAKVAAEGRRAVTETIGTMEAIKDEVMALEDLIESLNSASKQIGEIVNTITGIAHQTNLLALNAAIEAARAGEHGQGFTVVAEEVRKLAEESGEAAEDIGKKIKGMLEKTGNAVQTISKGTAKVIEGVNVANVAGTNLTLIVNSVTSVNKMIQDISNASREQSTNIESLRQSIESISGATKITSEGTKRVANAVNEQLNYIRQYIGVLKEILTLVQLMGDMLDKYNFR